MTDSSATPFQPLDDASRGYLRSVRINGGKMPITIGDKAKAQKCRIAGYLHITLDETTAKLTGHGQAYLDRLMRAH